MTIRERIADWISGGALTELVDDWLNVTNEHECSLDVIDELKERLDRIAACETPKANATVKRMAAIARGER